MRAYADSKLANILFTRELARRLAGTGVTTNSLHPGVVNTNLVSDYGGLFGWAANTLGPIFLTTPAKGAKTSLHVATAPELEGVSGEYFKSSKQSRPAKAGRDDVAARLLWQVSEELTSTENKIAFARQAYNDAVTVYNTYRETFPPVFFAGMFGHGSNAGLLEFDDAEQIREAPKVAF